MLFLASVVVAEEVCFVGYVMDTYCIDRGTLLDKPSLNTLEYPDKHSVHCLVDVGACRAGGYELLKDPDDDSPDGLYCRAYTLDSAGNDMVIQHAREVGDCSTCDSGGQQRNGYRATVKGTLVGSGRSPRLAVTSVEHEDVGCPGGPTEPDPSTLNCDSGNLLPLIIAHGSLMLVGWGVCIPCGVISARFLKSDPNRERWFEYHRRFQMGGLFLAIVGWIIALVSFNVIQGGPAAHVSYVHAVCGMVLMCLGIVQPLNACLRPPAPEPGEEPSYSRQLWEKLHKGGGYLAIILAGATLILGTLSSPASSQLGFQIA
ncbi:unnamed protein product, partial [Ectocarpus fasciculatus]